MVNRQIYIIGSKGIPAKYGGFETFVDKLTEYQEKDKFDYHVACTRENSKKSNYDEKHFIYNNADCFSIDVPNIGPAKAIYYDIKSLEYAITIAKKNKDEKPIFYILACRIGPFIKRLKREIRSIDGTLIINPDGHEWLRAKWSFPVRKYWKLSEKLMIKNSDVVVCDSKNIEKYILDEYKKYSPNTNFIAYGTDLEKSGMSKNSREVKEFYKKNNIKEKEYYLIVGRFVPENNLETILKEFILSNTDKKLVIISNVEKNKFYTSLKKNTGFENDDRIIFSGTVYNQDLLKYIRENSYGYIHGHEVGGTNPSLLEAMYSTQLNMLLDVGFNIEVGEETCLYWSKDRGSLSELITDLDKLESDKVTIFEQESTNRIIDLYNWSFIVSQYENLFDKV